MKETVNHFRRIYDLGYHRLVPIIPPGAQLSENSTLFRRIQKIGPAGDARGKAPGVKGVNGWYGIDLTKDMEVEFSRWHDMSAGVGIKTGRGLVAIDADTLNKDHARIIKQTIEKFVGKCPPLRVGQFPKALYVVRTDEDFIYTRIEFGERDAKGRLADRVEILADGRQFVAQGTHPKTGAPYDWKLELLPFDQLPFVPGETLHDILKTLQPLLPAASDLKVEGAGSDVVVDQETLRGDPKLVEKAVAKISNTSARFPTRESYLAVGYAIKAALPDDPAFAFELFADWCFAWQDGENDAEIVASDWDRMKPPFRRGAQYLYRLADEGGDAPGAFTAELYFDAEARDDPENKAAQVEQKSPNPFEQPADKSDIFEMLSVSDIMSLPPPRYLIDRHLMRQSTCLVYGDPGAGKSFLTLDWALHLASSAPDWHGDEIDPIEKPSVIYIAGEGVSGYQTRIKAWLARHPEADPALPGFRLIHQTMNFTSPEMVAKLVKSIKQVCGNATLIVVDTVAKSIAGAEENSTKEMGLFVAACVNISKHFDCAVIGVHHTNKMGGMRGSSAMPGGVDTIFKLERKKGSNTGYLMCEKQKDGPGEWTETFQLETVCVGVDHKGNPVSSLVVSKQAAEVQVASTQAAMLDALDAAWQEGKPWSDQMRAKERYAPRIMHLEFDVSADHAREILSGWLKAGVVVVDTVSAKSKTKGLRRVLFETENEPQNPFD